MALNLGAKFIVAAGVTGQGEISRFNVLLGQTASAGSKLTGIFSGARNAIAGLASVATGAGIGMLVKSTIELGDNLNKLSGKTGISVENLSKIQQAAAQADVDIGALSKGLKGLSQFIIEAGNKTSQSGKLFDALGLKGDDPNQILLQLADRFKELPDGALKSALSVKIFTKAGTDMIEMLNGGSAAITGLKANVDTGFAQAADHFNDSLQEIKSSLQGLIVDIGPQLLKVLQDVSDKLKKAFADPTVRQGIADLAVGLVKAFEYIVTNARTIISVFAAISGASAGAGIGASIGTAVGGPLGTVIGGGLGALTGGIAAGGGVYYGLGKLGVGGQRQGLRATGSFEGLPSLGLSYAGASGAGGSKMNAGALAGILSGDTDKKLELLKKYNEAIAKFDAENMVKEMAELEKITDKSTKALADFGVEVDQQTASIEAETMAIGKSTLQKKIYAAQLDIENAKIKELRDARNADRQAIIDQAETAKQKVAELLTLQDQINNSFGTGLKNSLNQIAEVAQNNAGLIGDAISGAFERSSDALAQFVTTGKLNFKSFVSSLLSDIARLFAQRALAGLITQVVGSFFAPSGSGYSGGVAVPIGHDGAVIGSSYSGSKSVSAGVFSGAPRFHTGGLVGGEVPIIAKRGEGVFTPDQMRALAPANSGGGTSVVVNVNMATGTSDTQSDSKDAAQLGKAISAAIQSELIKQRRPGGLLSAA